MTFVVCVLCGSTLEICLLSVVFQVVHHWTAFVVSGVLGGSPLNGVCCWWCFRWFNPGAVMKHKPADIHVEVIPFFYGNSRWLHCEPCTARAHRYVNFLPHAQGWTLCLTVNYVFLHEVFSCILFKFHPLNCFCMGNELNSRAYAMRPCMTALCRIHFFHIFCSIYPK